MSGGLALLLSRSSALLRRVCTDLLPDVEPDDATAQIRVQTARPGGGITDVEIKLGDTALVILEAKKGAALPSVSQLSQYAKLCRGADEPRTLLVALSSADDEVGDYLLGITDIDGVPVRSRTWRWVRRMVAEARPIERSSYVKQLLDEYLTFLEGLVGQEREYSNMVYVVSLARGTPPGWKATWIDIVEKHHKYFYQIAGGGWPSPPNYMGFRYDGRLQGIHHVERYEIVQDLRKHFPTNSTAEDWGPSYLLHLGPKIRPRHEVRTGPRINRSARVWGMLDTLLTEHTISEALTRTEQRRPDA